MESLKKIPIVIMSVIAIAICVIAIYFMEFSESIY